jgi:hypothetical protein
VGARFVASSRARAPEKQRVPDAAELAQRAAEAIAAADAAQRSQWNVNRQKGTVSNASPDSRKGKKAKARASIEELEPQPHGGALKRAHLPEDEPLTVEEQIAQQAQARYVTNAAIDAAIAQAYEGKDQPLTGVRLAKKQQIRFTQELWDEIITRTADGESLLRITQDEHMPTRRSVQRWVIDDPALDREYRAAILLKADAYAEQAKEMSLHGKRRAEMGASSEEINAIKTAASTLQWTAARLNPNLYGDKQQVDLNAKIRMPAAQVDARLQVLLAKAAAKKPGANDAEDTDAGDA